MERRCAPEESPEAGSEARETFLWKAPDGGAQVSAELVAESLLPIRCEVLYPNGKRVRYTYRVRAGADLRPEVYSLPQTVSSEERTLRHPLYITRFTAGLSALRAYL